ncbi:coil containing protein [Vibrio phage 1.184.A._10N.286.49.A5]|nr:coil containing protein [Vibrio phage 1.184.A._10N.286.49.A5]
MEEINTKLEESKSLAIVAAVSSVDIAERRGKINALEVAMLQEEQVPIDVNHRFNGGIYAREITIPKGTLLTGRIHKFDHFDIMLSGDISVSTDTGEVKRLTGLNIMEGKAGKKRAGYAHEDTHWITFHCAEERNPEEMYEFLTCGSFEELEEFNHLLEQAMKQIEHDEAVLTECAKAIVDKGDLCQ